MLYGACVVDILDRYMYPVTDSPRYIAGGSATAAVCVICALIALVVRFCLKRENKKLEIMENTRLEENIGHTRDEVDVRAIGFRYIL